MIFCEDDRETERISAFFVLMIHYKIQKQPGV
jgi:hypothetical protein